MKNHIIIHKFLAGAEVPEDIDGVSAVPVFLGEEMERPNVLYWESKDVRGMDRDDLAVAVRKGPWKAVANDGLRAGFELYNLDSDPAESQDLARQYPEKLQEFKQIVVESRTPSDIWPVNKELLQELLK